MLTPDVSSEQFYRELLETVTDGIYFVNRDRRIQYWNAAAARLSGFSASDMVGHSCGDKRLVHCDADGRMLCANGCPLAAVMIDGVPRTCEVFMRHKDGFRVPVRVTASAIMNEAGIPIGAVEVFSDNADRLATTAELNRVQVAASTDPLTGVSNRQFGELLLHSYLQQCDQGAGPGGVIFIDIDEFKSINDDFGHAAGDAALRAVAGTLSKNVRAADTVCRWGGDEFLILLPSAARDVTVTIAERCRALVASSYCDMPWGSFAVTCSLGVSMIHPDDTPTTVIGRADTEMYRSKQAGRNKVSVDAPDSL